MKKALIGAAIAALMGSTVLVACGGSDSPSPIAATPFTVKIIGFNDYHGTLESPGTFGQTTSVPAAQRPAVGGAEFIAAHVAALKKQNKNPRPRGAGYSEQPWLKI